MQKLDIEVATCCHNLHKTFMTKLTEFLQSLQDIYNPATTPRHPAKSLKHLNGETQVTVHNDLYLKWEG